MIKLITQWLALIGLAFFISSCSKPEPKLLTLQGQTMGTYYEIKYVADKNISLSSDQIQAEIDKRLEDVNNQMSTYRPDSELSRFNQAEKFLVISEPLKFVIQASLAIFEDSQGAFDITVGPLVNLWGFGPDKRPIKVPSEQLIAAKKKSVGSHYLTLKNNLLSKAKADLYVDLSSIAKGYGVDQVALYLQSIGVNNYLVDIGGELRVQGVKPTDESWTLAIERPSAGQNVQRLIQIGDNAIATSGDYRNYYEFDGIRYSHTINPKTGKPINHKLVSVTVIHTSCMLADGLATAITVLGPDAGFDFAEKKKLAVFLIVKKGDDFVEYYTSEFTPYLLVEDR